MWNIWLQIPNSEWGLLAFSLHNRFISFSIYNRKLTAGRLAQIRIRCTEMQGIIVPNVVVQKGQPILELFVGKDYMLFIGRDPSLSWIWRWTVPMVSNDSGNPFLTLEFGFHVTDSIIRFEFASEDFDKHVPGHCRGGGGQCGVWTPF